MKNEEIRFVRERGNEKQAFCMIESSTSVLEVEGKGGLVISASDV